MGAPEFYPSEKKDSDTDMDTPMTQNFRPHVKSKKKKEKKKKEKKKSSQSHIIHTSHAWLKATFKTFQKILSFFIYTIKR